MKLHPFLLTALLALGFAGPSHAVVVFSTLGQSFDGELPFDFAEQHFASDFHTDGSAWTIGGLTVLMSNSSQVFEQRIELGIFTDNGSGEPGTLVANFDEPVTVPTDRIDLFTTSSSSGIALQPDTSYWVVGQLLAPESLGTVGWAYNSGQTTDLGGFATVAGTQIQSRIGAGGNWGDYRSGNPIFALGGDLTSVPEPETWVGLLVTVGTALTFRWWRQG